MKKDKSFKSCLAGFIKQIKPYSGFIFVSFIVVIFAVSSVPSIPTLKIKAGNSVIRLDYFFHFCEYGLLTFFALLSLSDNDLKLKFNKLLIVLALLLAIAFLDELHQKIVPGRTYNIKDFISNSSGVISGLIISSILFRHIRKKQVL